MLKKNRVAKTILLRVDVETDRQIANIAKLKNISVSDAIREAIHAYSGYDTNHRIADRLDEIERRLVATSTSVGSDTKIAERLDKIEQRVVQQIEVVAQATNTNATRIENHLSKLTTRASDITSLVEKLGEVSVGNSKVILSAVKDVLKTRPGIANGTPISNEVEW